MARAEKNNSHESPAIPTLVEVNHDGMYIVAYCPVCDKSEKAKLEHAGQPRDRADSVMRIRKHFEAKHRNRKKFPAT